MKIRDKILLIFAIGTIVFVLTFICIQYVINNKINAAIEGNKQILLSEINNILKLTDADNNNIVNYYAHRIEINNFVKKHDKSWAANSIKIQKNSNINAFWIYDCNRTKVFSDFSSEYKSALNWINLPPEAFDSILQYHYVHFYIRTDSGIFRITGHAIHPDLNKEFTIHCKLSTVNGYFFTARMLNINFISQLEAILNTKITLRKPDDKVQRTEHISKTELVEIKQLFDINKKPVADLILVKQSPIAKTFISVNHYATIFLLIALIILLIIILLFYRIIIDTPLSLIIKTLKTSDKTYLSQLMNKSNEFGTISKLFNDFYIQKEQLINEVSDRKKAEEITLLSETNFKSLYENIASGILRTNYKGDILSANMAFVHLMGYSSLEEILKLNMSSNIYLFPEQRKVLIERLIKEGRLRNVEIVFKKKNGEPVICLVNLDIIKTEQKGQSDEKEFYQGVITDITDYKKLRSHLQRLEIAIKQSLDGVALLDKNKNFEFVNDAWAKMHGYSVQDMISENFNICYSPDIDSQKEITTLFEIVAENGFFSGDVNQMHKNGNSFKTLMSCSYVKDFADNIIGFSLIATDITDRIKNEEEIRMLNSQLEQKIAAQNLELNETNETLRKTIEELRYKEIEITKSKQLYYDTINSIHEWIHFLDKDLNFVLINDSLRNMHRKSGLPTDIIGKNLKDVYPFLDPKVTDAYKLVLETGKELITEEITTFNLINFNTETIKVPVFEGNKVTGVITSIHDVSEKKDMEKKVLAAMIEAEEKEKQRFSEDLHDGLGALLSTMKIYLNTILKKTTIKEAHDLLIQLKEMLYEAVDNTRSIAYYLTPNILVDFGLVKALKTYCDKLNRGQNIEIIFETNYNERLEHTIEVNIYRVILELINNSFKHSEANKIFLKVNILKDKLLISYSDNGKGFDSSNILKKKDGGMGINNIFARVKLLNGSCLFDSNSEEGTKVEIIVNLNNKN